MNQKPITALTGLDPAILKILEDCAELVGIDHLAVHDDRLYAHTDACKETMWNPYLDDGDAFRMASHLGMTVYAPEEHAGGPSVCVCIGFGSDAIEVWHSVGSGPDGVDEAKRHAIVECAALLAGRTALKGG